MECHLALTLHNLKEHPPYFVEGIEVIDVFGPRPVAGSICKINLEQHEFRVFSFKDLINKSLHPGYEDGCFTQTSVNLGASVQDFIQGNRYECEGLQAYPDWKPPYRDYYRKCLIASNTLQTNFIRSNGFVVIDGQVVAKPLHAPGRDDLDYVTFGIAGDYTCLLVAGTTANVISVSVLDPKGEATDPPLPEKSFGLASPRLVSKGQPTALERHDAPFRDQNRRLNGDWVDWDPDTTATSFTAFGVDETGKLLIMASVFEGEWGVDTSEGRGILPKVMAELLIKHGAHDAILGGGGSDTQQFVHGRYPRFRNGPVRSKAPSASRGEVEGIRGLGAIAGVLPRQ